MSSSNTTEDECYVFCDEGMWYLQVAGGQRLGLEALDQDSAIKEAEGLLARMRSDFPDASDEFKLKNVYGSIRRDD